MDYTPGRHKIADIFHSQSLPGVHILRRNVGVEGGSLVMHVFRVCSDTSRVVYFSVSSEYSRKRYGPGWGRVDVSWVMLGRCSERGWFSGDENLRTPGFICSLQNITTRERKVFWQGLGGLFCGSKSNRRVKKGEEEDLVSNWISISLFFYRREQENIQKEGGWQNGDGGFFEYPFSWSISTARNIVRY